MPGATTRAEGLGAPQLYLRAAPDRADGLGPPDTFLDITRSGTGSAAIECMVGQEHLWDYYTRVAENRANHFMPYSGGQSGGCKAKYAEGFQSVFPRTVDEL